MRIVLGKEGLQSSKSLDITKEGMAIVPGTTVDSLTGTIISDTLTTPGTPHRIVSFARSCEIYTPPPTQPYATIGTFGISMTQEQQDMLISLTNPINEVIIE